MENYHMPYFLRLDRKSATLLTYVKSIIQTGNRTRFRDYPISFNPLGPCFH